ncbi:long-chain fatty acid--CoA ligase [Marivirga atlantica]|jgi:long-chain acyl-CoA synthetase|uniref:Long-chain fatty acid--CoA ligase n=1 Tax=Marivirga atlantica TaxID=1548457 RepID=A0A937AD36_9BACT|nr:long-chain fatty acid--CoA ligase [Marivirga atlantica]MBL0764033.1 long-chain fatty acid--CoA ligase [Marivirga atlantica]
MTPTRLFDLLFLQQKNNPLPDALNYKVDGKWKNYSTDEVIDIVNKLSKGLLSLGVEKNDKVGIVSLNRPEWNFVDLALQQIGAVSVPMYPTITEKDYKYIFQDSLLKYVFAGDAKLVGKVTEAGKDLDFFKGVFSFDQMEGTPHWTQVLNKGEGFEADLDAYRKAVDPEDLVTLIYTSGTTGNPKGVMLTHNNVLSNSIAVSDNLQPDTKLKRSLSFLPLCHIFERTSSYFYMYRGVAVYYAESLETIADNLKEVKPDMFTTVPRLLEKIYDKIVAKGLELKGIKKSLFFWALELGHKFDLQKDQGWWYNFQLKMANKIIFSKWREAVGGNITLIASGGAALQPRLATIFWSAQIPVLEAYGLTETSPGISFNRYHKEDIRIGTVGPALPGVEIKIAEDGEVLCKGPNVMKGYYNQPEKTAEVLDADGWFHTGDIGEMVEGRFLKITDRKKEMFKTSGGKYVAPQLIENKLKESVLIEQAMVIGHSRKFPSALIVPNFDALRDYCQHKGIKYTTDAEMVVNDKIVDKLNREVEQANNNFAQWEKIKKIKILPNEWTVEAGELTAKLSLKRKIIENHYEQEIEGIYQD